MLGKIKTLLGQDWTDTQELIRSSLKSDIDLLDQTNAAILSTGGKQLRPLLSLLVARVCRSQSNEPLPRDSVRFAAATELLHNATLLHDDVADNSSVRRGVPTIKSLLGGPASVLVGDFWLVRAMENILSSQTHGATAIRIFAKTLSDLAEGEMLQLQKAESCDTTEEDYYRIIYSKTASLFEAAGVTAALSVGASDDFTRCVKEYCVSLGIAFQIRDDMLDYSDGLDLGKPVGADLDERKITLPLLGVLRSAAPEEEARIRAMVCEVPEHPEHKSVINDLVFESGGYEYAASRLKEYADKAISALATLPDSEEKHYLSEIAAFTVRRDK